MIKLNRLLTVILVFLILSGCSASSRNIVKQDGQYYLLIPSSVQSASNDIGCQPVAQVCFDSVEEMLYDINNVNFEEWEWTQISRFDKDEQGRVLLCDLSKLYVPVFPTTYGKYVVYWSGDYYSYLICNDDEVNFVILRPFPLDNFKRDEVGIQSIVGNDYYAEVHSQEHIADRDADVVQYTAKTGVELMDCFYQIESSGSTLHIRERYHIEESMTVPCEIDIWGTYQDTAFHVHIPSLTERPSVEWLAQFGLKEYVETSVS